MGNIHPNLVAVILKWVKEYDKGVINFYFTYKVAPVDRARNQCVDYFFNAKGKGDLGFTHLLFIDADTIPPAHGLRSLLAADADIVTGLTPMLQFDKEKNTWATMYNTFVRGTNEKGEATTSTPPIDGRLHEIDRCGSSFVMIKKEVLKAMKKPYYKFILTDDGLEHKKSEDIGFCDTAKELGFKVVADTNVVCSHFKSVML
jgi:hypothetical protein